RSLTQTAGRAARNLNGKVIFYADKITESMQLTMDETTRRREKQLAYNQDNNITPTQIVKSMANILGQTTVMDVKNYENEFHPEEQGLAADPVVQYMSKEQLQKSIAAARKQME